MTHLVMNLSWSTVNAFSGHLGAFAWQVLWQSSVLILVIWPLDVLLKRHVRASVRYGLWLLVLLKLLLPPSLAVPCGLAWWVRPQVRQIDTSALPSRNLSVQYATDGSPSLLSRANSTGAPLRPQRCSSTSIGVACSFLVTGLLLGWMIHRQGRVSAILRHALPAPESLEELIGEAKASLKLNRRVRLLVTKEPVSPALCGLFDRSILVSEALATRLSAQQLRAVLLHELAHLKRGDVWASCVQSLLQLVYWWHPLLWLANARIRRVREEAVDDAVMSALSEESPSYAPTLLEVARLALRRPVTALGLVGILESHARLKERVQRLLDGAASPRKAGVSITGLLWLATFGVVALPMGPAPAVIDQSTPQASPPISADRRDSGMKTASETRELEEAKTRVAAYLRRVNGVPPNPGRSVSTAPTPGLAVRIFKVDANTLKENLSETLGDIPGEAPEFSERLREFFSSVGIELDSPKALVYSHRDGSLIVQATASELDKIEQVLSQWRQPTIQINARIQTTQLSRSQAATFWAGISLQNPGKKSAVLNAEQAREQLTRLRALAAPGEISQPSIMTASGRQAQIQVAEMSSVVTESNAPSGDPVLQTNQVPVGLRVDLLPSVGPDLSTVKMEISASLTQWLGYDNHAPSLSSPLPVPHFRVRQKSLTVCVSDGQTVVLGGFDEFETQVPVLGDVPVVGRLFRHADPENELILFVTPTVVDSTGNPVHQRAQ